MLLGAIMTELADESSAAAALLSFGDIVLVAQVEAARLPHEESIGEYVSGAAQRFANQASDEDWLGLMTALERSQGPAATCLSTMVRWSLKRDASVARVVAPGSCCGSGCSFSSFSKTRKQTNVSNIVGLGC